MARKRTYPFLNFNEQTKTAVLCGRESVQIRPPKVQQRNLKQLADQLGRTGGKVEANDFLLSFTIGEERMVILKMVERLFMELMMLKRRRHCIIVI